MNANNNPTIGFMKNLIGIFKHNEIMKNVYEKSFLKIRKVINKIDPIFVPIFVSISLFIFGKKEKLPAYIIALICPSIGIITANVFALLSYGTDKMNMEIGYNVTKFGVYVAIIGSIIAGIDCKYNKLPFFQK